MIELTRLNGHTILINGDLIKYIEAAPDTMITLITGDKLVVLEPCEEVARQVSEHKSRLLAAAWPGVAEAIVAKLASEFSKLSR